MDRRGAASFVEDFDQPLDLAPAAIMDDIAKVAAASGARPGLIGGKVAEPLDELRRVRRRFCIGNMDVDRQSELPSIKPGDGNRLGEDRL